MEGMEHGAASALNGDNGIPLSEWLCRVPAEMIICLTNELIAVIDRGR